MRGLGCLIGVAVASLALAGCDKAKTAPIEEKAKITGAAPGSGRAPAAPVAGDLAEVTRRLLAAAEPFEALAESAFARSRITLATQTAQAGRALAAIRDIVPRQAGTQMQLDFARLQRARGADNRAEVALASIEIYRDLVSAVPGGPAVPIDVSLLDYAGFRFNADVQASPPRWDDMAKALVFARQRWASTAPLGPVAPITNRFDAALDAMDDAVRRRDPKRASASATAELELVDELENAFAKPLRAP